MPITLPVESTKAPPESPDWMLALTWMRSLSCSVVPVSSLLAVIDWVTAVTEPAAAVGVPPVPPALPAATTLSPTVAATVLVEAV